MNQRVSAVVVARNESMRITSCLESLAWADEVLVVDSGSTDNTVELCTGLGVRVLQTQWRGYTVTRNFAIDAAAHDWVLCVDADEVVTGRLRDAVRGVLREPHHQAYKIRREAFYLGRLMRFGGWGRDWHVRLFDRRSARWAEKAVHEYVKVSGTKGVLEGTLVHHPYEHIEHHIAKINAYTTLAARELATRGRQGGPLLALLRAIATFVRMYVLRAGFLDGGRGLVLAVNSSHYTFLKYAKLWEQSSSR